MNLRGILAIYTFEMARAKRTIWQSLMAPVITTSLFLLVFGSALGPGISGMLIDLGYDFPSQMAAIGVYFLIAAVLAWIGTARAKRALAAA